MEMYHSLGTENYSKRAVVLTTLTCLDLIYPWALGTIKGRMLTIFPAPDRVASRFIRDALRRGPIYASNLHIAQSICVLGAVLIIYTRLVHLAYTLNYLP